MTTPLPATATLLTCLVVEKTVGFRLDERRETNDLDFSLDGESGYGPINAWSGDSSRYHREIPSTAMI